MTRIEQRQYVGVLQPCEEANFPDEPQLAGFRCRVGIQDLQRDAAIMPQVPREVDGREGALADFALYLKSAGERGTEWGERILWSDGTCHAANINAPSIENQRASSMVRHSQRSCA